MHLRYVTTHAPDSVIFPFLHGLEGDNDAQNAFFFANGSMAAVNASTALGSDGVETIDREKLKARVPRFRGLVWVASDEDEVEEYERAMKARHRQAHSHHASSHVHDDLDDDISDDIEEDDYSTSSLDDEEEVEDDDFAGMQMDIDDHVDLNAGVVGMDVDLHGRDGVTDLMDHGEGAHMHPVVHAHRPALSAIDTSSKGEFLSTSTSFCSTRHSYHVGLLVYSSICSLVVNRAHTRILPSLHCTVECRRRSPEWQYCRDPRLSALLA